jgi:hypothetical protein
VRKQKRRNSSTTKIAKSLSKRLKYFDEISLEICWIPGNLLVHRVEELTRHLYHFYLHSKTF